MESCSKRSEANFLMNCGFTSLCVDASLLELSGVGKTSVVIVLVLSYFEKRTQRTLQNSHHNNGCMYTLTLQMLVCAGSRPATLSFFCNLAPLLLLCLVSRITPRILLLIRSPFMVKNNKTSIGSSLKKNQKNTVVLWLYWALIARSPIPDGGAPISFSNSAVDLWATYGPLSDT